MSDRIAVMNQGIIEQIAPPEEVYERPATTFVAGFIGVSNLMPGHRPRLSGEKAEVELEAGVTVAAGANGLATGERCHAVVRPGEARRHRQPTAPAPRTTCSVEGVVASSVYLGTATQLVVELAGDVADDRARARTPTRPSASACPAAAPTCGSPGPRSTSTWSASPAPSAPPPTTKR